ncbi:MAG TPA: ribosome-associated translation inhibitor RaiA [Acidimicrobiales bacterium]|nr:ribosome-associated translation inhibitor RaiA [Acidimicrobiales bacterium]
MEITVSARHIDVSPALRAAAEAKLGRLSRFGDEFERAEVHFVEERNPRIAHREVCDVVVEGRGRRLRAKAAAADAFAAIDLVVAKLEHQVHSLKTKLSRSHG